MNIIETNIQNIRNICVKHHVRSLAVFGSVLTEKFNDNSDIDFVVDFSNVELENYADNYLEMLDSLRDLLGRDIDLLEAKAIQNSVLINAINNTKQTIYG